MPTRGVFGSISVALGVIAILHAGTPDKAFAQSQHVPTAASTEIPGDPGIEREFLRALALLDNGTPDRAIPILLSILASNPTLVRVRLELARAYFEAEQWSRAREEFFTVLSGGLPVPVRRRVLSFIREIDARRGFEWDLTFGITSVGNQRRYDTEAINLDFGGIIFPFRFDRPTADELGLRIAGSADYRRDLRLSDKQAIDTVAFASASFDVVDARTSTYDDYEFGAQLGLRLLSPTMTVSLGPFVSTRFIASERFEDEVGFEVSFERRNLLGGSAFGFASIADLTNRRSDDLSGREINALLGFRRSVGGQATIGFSLGLQERDVNFSLEDYRDTEVRVFGTYDAKFGVTLRPSFYIGRKEFRNPSALFTASPDERSVGATLRFEKNDIFIGNGFSPFADLQFERTKSDIAAFSFRETHFQLGLERRF